MVAGFGKIGNSGSIWSPQCGIPVSVLVEGCADRSRPAPGADRGGGVHPG